jgi:hypothetical protein
MEKWFALAAVSLLLAACFFVFWFQNVGPESPKWVRVTAYISFAILGLAAVWLVILFVFTR